MSSNALQVAAVAFAILAAQPVAATAEITKVDSLGTTVRDSLSQGLVVWAVNAYCPSRDWEALVHKLKANRPGILETAFGEEQAERLEEDLQDLHVQVLHGLRARIIRGALRKSEWNGLYEVSLTVLRFRVRNPRRPVTGRPCGIELRAGSDLVSPFSCPHSCTCFS